MTTRPPRSTDPSGATGDGSEQGAPDGGRQSHREKKLERQRLDELTDRLVSLRPHELDHLSLDDDLRQAVDELGALSGSARGRQARFLHGLLRRSDLDDVERRVRKGSGSSYAPVPESRKSPVERWLERLLAEGDGAVNELVEAHAGVDRQQLRQLIRTSRKTPASAATRRAERSLRTILDELLD